MELTEAVLKAIDALERSGKARLGEATKEFFERGGSNQTPYDLLAVAVLNRSRCLLRAFCGLLRLKNFVAAAPLIRLHLDSALRFAAPLIAGYAEKTSLRVLDGERLDKMKTVEGVPLTDRFLVKKLTERYAWVRGVYESTSGYIHLSRKHIANAIRVVEPTSDVGQFDMKVSDEDVFIPEADYLRAVDVFGKLTEIIAAQVTEHVDRKRSRP